MNKSEKALIDLTRSIFHRMGRQSDQFTDSCRKSDNYSRPWYPRVEGAIDDRHRSSRENSDQRSHFDKRSGRIVPVSGFDKPPIT